MIPISESKYINKLKIGYRVSGFPNNVIRIRPEYPVSKPGPDPDYLDLVNRVIYSVLIPNTEYFGSGFSKRILLNTHNPKSLVH